MDNDLSIPYNRRSRHSGEECIMNIELIDLTFNDESLDLIAYDDVVLSIFEIGIEFYIVMN